DLNVSGMVSSIQEGQTFTVNVSLTNPPLSTQEVVISTGSTSLLVNGSQSVTLNFDASNYSASQSITFSSVVDSNSNNESVTVTFSLTNLSESQYSVTIVDDTSISITGVPSTLLEGTTATLNVNFSKTLLSDNTITVTSSNSAAISFSGASTTTLNYTTANGTSPQAITILAEEDTNLANETVTLTFTANGVASSTVTIRTTDNDGQNIVLTNGADFLREGGATGTIDVHLSFDPGADAVVTVTSGNSNSLSVSPSTLTFNSSNYTIDQQVTLTALNEINQTSEDVTVLFTTTGATPQIHPLKTIDDDIQVVIAGANTVNEGGQSTVIISLSGDPGETRVINLTPSDTNAVTLSTNSLTFTSDNYSQSILIYGVEDTNVASESVTITAIPAVAGGIVGATQNITTVDNDSMNIVLSGLGSTMVNEGLTTTFKVNLTHDPGGDLTVNFGSSYSGVTLTPSSFTFNSSNYNSQQTITINALQDANQDSENVTITASATGVTTSPTIQITTIEDDTVPVITGNATVAEGGFTVLNLKLSGNPGNNRTVTVDLIGTTSSVSLSSNTFNFTPNNYDAVQTFIITGLQDTNVANESFTVRATFDSVNYITHSMSTVDNDLSSFGLIVTNVSETTTVNEGSSLQFKVRLNFEPPSSPYTVTVSSPQTSPAVPGYVNNPTYVIDPANSGVGSTTLTFTSCTGSVGCWDTDQTVTINAPENYYIDDKTTTLTFSG
ncbi:MAG: hypothetical protein KDK36_01240, partial [Leptospiraceae bacterium]|nr:hypothetical protein [Leptospiraceae bacterium]